MDGFTEPHYLSNVTGYALMITDGFSLPFWSEGNCTGATIALYTFNKTEVGLPITVLGYYCGFLNNEFPEKLHLRITRTQDGQFTVYSNSVVAISAQENTASTSEYLGLLSWQEKHQVDNLTVSTTITPTTTTTSTPSWTPLIVLVSLVIVGFRKRRLEA